MGWTELATEDAIARSERAVAALIGTLSNPRNETFGAEVKTILRELDGDTDEVTRLIACVTGIAALGIKTLGGAGIDPEDESPESAAARREGEMFYLDAFSQTLRMLQGGK